MKATESLLQHWHAMVSQAAQAFEARWTLAALRRVDPDIAQRLQEQRDIFVEACVTGKPQDVLEHGSALCRGYVAASQALEDAGEPDSAYLLGQCPQSGFRVAIGDQKAAAARVAAKYGSDVVWMTPDEVATLIVLARDLQQVIAIKRAFPGAEITKVQHSRPAS